MCRVEAPDVSIALISPLLSLLTLTEGQHAANHKVLCTILEELKVRRPTRAIDCELLENACLFKSEMHKSGAFSVKGIPKEINIVLRTFEPS